MIFLEQKNAKCLERCCYPIFDSCRRPKSSSSWGGSRSSPIFTKWLLSCPDHRRLRDASASATRLSKLEFTEWLRALSSAALISPTEIFEPEGIQEPRYCAVSSSAEMDKGGDPKMRFSRKEWNMDKGGKDKEVSHRDEVKRLRTSRFNSC